MDELNELNGSEEDVVDPQNTQDEQSTSGEVNEAEYSENKQDAPAQQKQEQNPDENSRFAAARRQAEQEANSYKTKMASFAKQYGYNSFEEMEQATQQKQYEQKGYDEETSKKLANVDRLLHETEIQKQKARISEEKSKLQNQRFFKDLEADIDSILEQNPNLSVDFVYKHVRGEKMDELLDKGAKAAQQKALNNFNGKAHMKLDGGGVDIDTTQIDPEEWRIYSALNKKATKEEYAKFLKSEKQRR